ncbi:MAG: PAS domain S-box protein [Planctomycetes bacterium]|nr:PAS domain S-box protein [Planctomycetota bacterium]
MQDTTTRPADLPASSADSESTYRAIFDAVNDAIFIHDGTTGRIVDVNRTMCELFGYTHAEALNLSVQQISAGEGFSDEEAQRLIRLAATEPQVFEWHCRDRGGRTFWAEVSLRRAPIAGDERILAVVRDISRRRDAEHALRRSERRYRTIIEDLPDLVCRYRPDMTITYVNDSYARCFGRARGELVGTSFLDLIPPRERDLVRAQLDLLGPRLLTGTYEHQVIAAKDERRWQRWTNRALVNEEGHVVEFQGIGQDITEQRRATEALRESEERLRSITDNAPDYIMLLDLEYRIQLINRTVPDLKPEDVIGRSILDFVPEENHARIRACFKRVLKTREPDGYDTEYVAHDGTRTTFKSRVGPVLRGDEVVAFALASSDVTRRRETEERLRRTNEKERLLLRELDHRVRNNLASLVSLVDLTRRSAESIDEFANAIRGRVHAMSTGHELLSRSSWAGLGLRRLIRSLAPPGTAGAVATEGETIQVPAEQVSSLAMVLHELYMNSAKHGALAAKGGHVEVTWTARPLPDGGSDVSLRWRETDGPAIDDAVSPRVGTSLIEGLARSDLQGDVTFAYPASGADHRLTMTFAPVRRDRS